MNQFSRRTCKLLAGLVIAFSGSLVCTSAMAQPAGAEGNDFIYRIEQGDALLALAHRYTGDSSNWERLQTINQVADPERMRIGRELRIPFALIPELLARATVAHIVGQVTVNNVPLKIGAQVAEGDVVRTAELGFVKLVLSDDSALSVPAGSVLHIKRLREFQGTQLTDAILDVKSGAVESLVAPAHTGVGRFEVRTPVTITGVRGTRLRVRVNDNGAQSEVMTGRARVRANQQGNAMVHGGQGAATDTAGTLLGVRPLLPRPVLSEPVRHDGRWQVDFKPIPGAVAYQVQISDDIEGTQLYSSERISAPPVSFSAPGAGVFYVSVRAIDSDQVMGEDATKLFVGRPVLMSNSGRPIMTAFAEPITLMDY